MKSKSELPGILTGIPLSAYSDRKKRDDKNTSSHSVQSNNSNNQSSSSHSHQNEALNPIQTVWAKYHAHLQYNNNNKEVFSFAQMHEDAKAFHALYEEKYPSAKKMPVFVAVTAEPVLYHLMETEPSVFTSPSLLILANARPAQKKAFENSRDHIGNALSGQTQPEGLSFYRWYNVNNHKKYGIGFSNFYSNFESFQYEFHIGSELDYLNEDKHKTLNKNNPVAKQYIQDGIIMTKGLRDLMEDSKNKVNDPYHPVFSTLAFIIKSYYAAIDIKLKRNEPVSFDEDTAVTLYLLLTASEYAEVRKIIIDFLTQSQIHSRMFPTMEAVMSYFELLGTIAQPAVQQSREAALHKENEELIKQRKELQDQVAMQEEDIKNIQDRLNSSYEIIEKLYVGYDDYIEFLENREVRFKDELAKQEEKIEENNKTFAKERLGFDEKLKQSENEWQQKLTSEISEHHKMVANLQKELKNVQAAADESNQKIAQLEKKIEAQSAMLFESTARSSSASQQEHASNEAIIMLRKQIADQKTIIAGYEQTNAKQADQISTLEGKIRKLGNNHNQQNNADHLRHEKAAMEKNNKLAQTNKDLKAALHEKNKQLAEKDDELAKMKQLMQAMQEKLNNQAKQEDNFIISPFTESSLSFLSNGSTPPISPVSANEFMSVNDDQTNADDAPVTATSQSSSILSLTVVEKPTVQLPPALEQAIIAPLQSNNNASSVTTPITFSAAPKTYNASDERFSIPVMFSVDILDNFFDNRNARAICAQLLQNKKYNLVQLDGFMTLCRLYIQIRDAYLLKNSTFKDPKASFDQEVMNAAIAAFNVVNGQKIVAKINEIVARFEKDTVNLKKTIWDQWFLKYHRELSSDPLAITKEILVAIKNELSDIKKEYPYHIGYTSVLYVHLHCLKNKTQKNASNNMHTQGYMFAEHMLDRKWLTCMTSLCDQSTLDNLIAQPKTLEKVLETAIKEFQQNNILDMTEQEKRPSEVRSLLCDIIDTFKVVRKFTAVEHQVVQAMLAGLRIGLNNPQDMKQAVSIIETAKKASNNQNNSNNNGTTKATRN